MAVLVPAGSEVTSRTAAAVLAAAEELSASAARDGGRPEPARAGRELITCTAAAGHLRPAGHRRPGRAVAEALIGLAAEQHAAAIVVGSRGRSALWEILLGSVAMATLMRRVRPLCPRTVGGRGEYRGVRAG